MVSNACCLVSQIRIEGNLGCCDPVYYYPVYSYILPGILCPVLEFSVQGTHGPVGAGPKEGHKNNQRSGVPLLWRWDKRLKIVQCGVSEALGRPYGDLPVLKGGLKERWRQIFLSGPIVIGLMSLKSCFKLKVGYSD